MLLGDAGVGRSTLAEQVRQASSASLDPMTDTVSVPDDPVQPYAIRHYALSPNMTIIFCYYSGTSSTTTTFGASS